MSEPSPSLLLHRKQDSELFIIAAASPQALADRIQTVLQHLQAAPATDLADLAFTLNTDSSGACRLALVAADVPELVKKLVHARDRIAQPDCKRIQDRSGIFYFTEPLGGAGRVAFIFPGEGAQFSNMMLDICLRFPEAREAFDEADRACELAGDGFVPSEHIFPKGPQTAGWDHDSLWSWEGAVEAVVAADMAYMRILNQLGIKPDATIGHSIGEFMALETGGILRYATADDRISFMRDGYLLIKELTRRDDIPAGVLLTVGGPDRAVIDALVKRHAGKVRIALSNCPHQNVLCVEPEVADQVTQELVQEGGIVSPLPFARPYHTDKINPALDGVRNFFRTRKLHAPSIPTYSCMSADRFPDDLAEIERLCVGQWANAVLFHDAVEKMYESGVRIFLEVGPRGNLTSFVDDVLKGKPHAGIPINRINKSGVFQLNFALAQLAAHGVPMALDYLYARRGCKRLALGDAGTAKPVRSREVNLWSSIPRLAAGGIRAPKPAPVPGQPVTLSPAAAVPAVRKPKMDPQFVMAYMDTMEQFLAIQQDMLGRMLPATARTPAPVAPVAPVPQQVASPSPVAAKRQWPMITEIIEHKPGESLVAMGKYDIKELEFLTDHTLGTVEVSVADPTLTAVPIIPLCMSLDILSEAANNLVAGKVVVGLKDIQATRWISFEEGYKHIRISARVLARGPETEVRVEIRDAMVDDARAAFRPSLVEGTVLLADQYPPRPPVWPFHLRNERPCHWTGKQIYPERLFHGPRFQGTSSITRWGVNGVQGTVTVLPKDKLFRSNPAPQFCVDGIFIDSMGAALGLWGAYETFDGNVFLPFRVKELRVYGPLQPPGTTFQLNLEIVREGQGMAAADITATDANGNMYLSIKEFEDRIFPITPVLHKMFLKSVDTFMTDEVVADGRSGPAFGAEVVARVSADIPMDLFESSHRVWQRMTSFLVLNRAEREQWKALEGKLREQTLWLLGRIAVKDAVRSLLQTRHRIRMGAPDIHIHEDSTGRLTASGPWTAKMTKPLQLAMDLSGDTAVAVACESGKGGVGVAIADLRVTAETAKLNPDDLKLAGTLPFDAQEARVRVLCAQAALARTSQAGAGLSVAQAKDGRFSVRSTVGSGAPIFVSTVKSGNRIIAFCQP